MLFLLSLLLVGRVFFVFVFVCLLVVVAILLFVDGVVFSVVVSC